MSQRDRILSGELICPACGRAVGPRHLPRTGRPRCQRGNVFWTPARLWRLTELTEQGWDDDRIAARLTADWGRPLSRSALHVARWRHRQPGPRGVAVTANDAAQRIGVHSGEVVARWAENGWLRARRGVPMGRGFAWLIDLTALCDFLSDPLHWHRWSPDAISDPVLRRFVASVRVEPTHVPLREAVTILADRGIHVSRSTVDRWVRLGHLPSDRPDAPGSRRSITLIPVAALATVEPPPIGGDRRREAA